MLQIERPRERWFMKPNANSPPRLEPPRPPAGLIPKRNDGDPLRLAPTPWPQGVFRIDPET